MLNKKTNSEQGLQGVKMIVKFDVKDKLQLKKKHPCGSSVFTVARVGSDIRILCDGCGRDVILPRVDLEKRIKKVIPREGN